MSEGGEQTLRTPWGRPWSLRINGVENWASELNKMNLLGTLSSQLRELDLRGVHGGFSEEFRLAIITSSPNLSVLALPVCFFASSAVNGAEATQKESTARNLATLTKAMQKLKTITLSDNTHGRDCPDCSAELTSAYLVRFSDLKDLDELHLSSIRYASLDVSVLDHLGSSNLRALSLRSFHPSGLSGLRRSLRRSPNLRYLKLEGYDAEHDLEYITEALQEMKNVRQLCLSPNDLDPGSIESLLLMLERLPQNLEVLHIHRHDPSRKDPLVDQLDLAVRDLAAARGKEIFYEDSDMSLVFVRNDELPQFASGRALCSRAVPIGYVKPIGWNVE